MTVDDSARILNRLTDNDLLRAERRALIHHLIDRSAERPGEAMIIEMDHVARICKGRIIEREGEDGSVSLFYATRNTQHETPRLDDIYQLIRKPDGTVWFQVDFMRHAETGYRMVGDSEGNMAARAIMKGYNLAVAPHSEGGRRLLEDYMDRSLETARIMKDRWQKDPEAAKAADAQAKEMLEAYLEATAGEK
jgi:hypothetical protein